MTRRPTECHPTSDPINRLSSRSPPPPGPPPRKSKHDHSRPTSTNTHHAAAAPSHHAAGEPGAPSRSDLAGQKRASANPGRCAIYVLEGSNHTSRRRAPLVYSVSFPSLHRSENVCTGEVCVVLARPFDLFSGFFQRGPSGGLRDGGLLAHRSPFAVAACIGLWGDCRLGPDAWWCEGRRLEPGDLDRAGAIYSWGVSKVG